MTFWHLYLTGGSPSPWNDICNSTDCQNTKHLDSTQYQLSLLPDLNHLRNSTSHQKGLLHKSFLQKIISKLYLWIQSFLILGSRPRHFLDTPALFTPSSPYTTVTVSLPSSPRSVICADNSYYSMSRTTCEAIGIHTYHKLAFS